MLQRISNSWIFSFDGKASLKKNKNLDKGENHSQILQSSTWSQKSQLYLCEMQLPETHMKPVVLDKCISFQFSHWHLCDWQKSFLAYEQDDSQDSSIHISLKECTDQNRTQIQAVEALFLQLLCVMWVRLS